MFSLFRNPATHLLHQQQKRIQRINALEAEMKSLSLDDCKKKTKEYQALLEEGGSIESIQDEACALIREVAHRTLDHRHFDIQIIGGLVLYKGSIAEMHTGEGKTLVATIPAYLHALHKKGVHIVTVNDYLARLHAVWMGQIYAALGMTVGVVNQNNKYYVYDEGHKEVDEERDNKGSFHIFYEFLRPATAQDAYNCDITYGTNNQFAFDYLTDNLVFEKNEVKQRGHHYAIVDEVDSILIDEARTPLIISEPIKNSAEFFSVFSRIAKQLSEGVHYTLEEKSKRIILTEEGIKKGEQLLKVDNLYTEENIKKVHALENAVSVQALYKKDREYVVRDNTIVIVDEFTGRLMVGRRWGQGLHEAVESKEGLPVKNASRTVASITFQNYFRLYTKLAGMTGTAMTSKREFYKVYKLDVVPVPTNRPIQRIDKNDIIYQTEEEKLKAIVNMVSEKNKKGQPILLGSPSIEQNERLAILFDKARLSYNILNAKNHEREGEIIAQAGKKKSITLATNLAGRGVDIKLGGAEAEKSEYEEVKSLGGLCVIGSERYEARRIDNQLRGRAGRQGDPGETIFFISFDDQLMRIFGGDRLKNMTTTLKLPKGVPIENSFISKSIEGAQKRVEGHHFDVRRNVLEYDEILNEQRSKVYEWRNKIFNGTQEDLITYITPYTKGLEESKGRKLIEYIRSNDTVFQKVRHVILHAIRVSWVDHIDAMTSARDSVGLRGLGQQSPLIEYRKEGVKLYKKFEDSVDTTISHILPKIV